MSSRVKRFLAVMMTAAFIVLGPIPFICMNSSVNAEVGSIADGEDITYDKNGGVLASMGFDTSKMPDTYDPDATTNPYGSDVSMLNEVKEGVWFDMTGKSGAAPSTVLFGHNKKLNGSYDEFTSGPIRKGMSPWLGKDDFVYAVKCDITGDGRDSALAVVYTHYTDFSATPDRNIYMCLYDPASGRHSEPFVISSFYQDPDDLLLFNYLVQSQLQITAGDYDKDSIDEIAVFSPAQGMSEENKIMFFDLTDGKDCKDPYNKSSWRHSWNYMLPLSSERVITTSITGGRYAVNMYNNLDLTSGDADNDGICDLVISYGASDTDYGRGVTEGDTSITRSIPSKSVLLYGSDTGQMLRDSQVISYGGTDLIRVSFAFGDVDADGNEDMFIAGQAQNEQADNFSRMIGRYIYDKEKAAMTLESMQNMKVVSGTWVNESGDTKKFHSANGWDGYYYSVPLMKTNLAVGKIMGDASDTKIYLDSVLYSYDGGKYEISDELEDASVNDKGKNKGSCVFGGSKAMKGRAGNSNKQSTYYEFGADCGNFTAAPSDYVLVNRVSTTKSSSVFSGDQDIEATSSILFVDSKGNLTRKDPVHGNKEYDGIKARNHSTGVPVLAVAADTDVDGLVAEYTGEHNIQYQNPAVLAVLASPPYFRDVAAYDENDMLVYLTTEYGSSNGVAHGHETSFSSTLGGFVNTSIGADKAYFIFNVGVGWAREETWGWEKERVFEMSYATEAGEDAVVMYSIPTENYTYKVRGVSVDDDGNLQEFTNIMVVPKPHKPVTQTLTLEDYNEIQSRYSDKLPDVTKYLRSTPGDPSSYPRNENDIPAEAKSHIDKNTYHPIDMGEKWAGVAFGSGSITQTLSYSKETRDRYDNYMDGAYFSTEIGGGNSTDAILFFHTFEAGGAFEFSQVWGDTKATLAGADCSGTLKNMPRSAKGYGYDFSWKLFKYNIKDKGCTFPVVTYIVDDVSSPPELPETIEQDFDNTTDSQIALTWTYNKGNPQAFDIYRYEDFPIGGGDKLIGTVSGSNYKIMKDEDGNTMRDKDGHVIREYSFVDTDLTADTKYEYRMKVRTAKLPGESIFSPVIEARTDVGTKPELSLSADELTIYPDSTYNVKVNLADPENYQSNISYQWQKYDAKKRTWEDVEGCNKQKLYFFNCSDDDEGTYRCRVNLVRKVESGPQYISAFTDSCTVAYSLRSVEFGKMQVFEGTGNSRTNTGISVKLTNTNPASLEKPTGMVTFDISGPNGTIKVASLIDEETSEATVNSIEDRIGDLGQTSFVDGGYVITASYEGSGIFYPAKSPEEYHYLRNIDQSKFLSMKSSYIFGEDIAETAGLFDYKATAGGVSRTDLTDKITKFKFYQVTEDGLGKTGDAVAEYVLSETSGKAPVPLNKKLTRRAYVEAYIEGSEEPAASMVIRTRKIQLQLDINDKITGTGELLEFLSHKDVKLSNGMDPEAKIIETDSGTKKSLSEFLLFNYYQQNGDLICNSDWTEINRERFIPASYYATVAFRPHVEEEINDQGEWVEIESESEASWFFNPTYKGGRFMVVGNFYHISAGPKDKSTGSVRMISPDNKTDFTDEGYVGGTKLVLKAEPHQGYEISKWIINECGTKRTVYGSDILNYTVRSQNTEENGEITITAEMKPKESRLRYEVIGNGSVTVIPSVGSGDNVLAGTKLTFTAMPQPGWSFKEWRCTTLGGNSAVSGGVQNEDGSNTKEFTMPDGSAEVYALFSKYSADVTASQGLDVLYVNNGGDPYHDVGELVMTEKGRNVPRGSEVIVRTRPGIELAPGASWKVVAVTNDGAVNIPVTETLSQGREACTFTLPEDAVSCSVSVETVIGKFTVQAETDGVQFTISVDGQEMEGSTVEGIPAGSQVDIKARPDRGECLTGWTVNGEQKGSTDTLYSCNITENMNVAVTTEPVEEYSLRMKAEGGGTLRYAISDTEGIEVDTGDVNEAPADADAYTVSVYPGESVRFRASEDNNEYTLTSISMNGVKQDLTEGTFTIDSVEGDTEILARFGSNRYFSAEFSKNFRSDGSMLLDENDDELANGEILKTAKHGDLRFSLILQEGRKKNVRVNDGVNDYEPEPDGEPEAYDEGRKRYTYTVNNVTSDLKIAVADHEILYISNANELQHYLNILKDREYDQPDGILTADIDMSGKKYFPIDDMYARFDGNGYTISNLSEEIAPSSTARFRGIFGTIHEEAYIKDVVFDKIKVKGTAYDAERGVGLLSYKNYGTISGVTILDSEADLQFPDKYFRAAGLAYENLGVIEHCMISGLTLTTNHPKVESGAAGVVFNQHEGSEATASMTGNYLENLTIHGSDGTEFAVIDIVAVDMTDAHKGSFAWNYYRQTYNSYDPFGYNVFKRFTENPDDWSGSEAEVETAEFSRKLAYSMNKELGEKVWGVTGNTDDDKGVYLLSRRSEGEEGRYYAPVKVEYVSGMKRITRYIAPGEIELPGAELFGDSTPVAWEIGDRSYLPGETISITSDIRISGISDIEDYVASLSVESESGTVTVYYKNIDDALRDAAANTSDNQELKILGDVSPSGDTLNVGANTTMTVADGATLMISKNMQMNNKGTIRVESGATVNKYGSLLNEGTLVVEEGSEFYNYGSPLSGKGEVEGREFIICKPHIFGEWSYADTPDEQGRWTRTSTCKICGNEKTEEVQPDPPAVKVDNIEITREPDKMVFEVGDQFDDTGLMVTANLTDGTKAAVTQYILTLKLGDDESSVRNGDVLDVEGTGKVVVSYDKFTAEYDIVIINTSELLTLTDGDGKDITEAEMEPGDVLSLKASLKSRLPYKTRFSWAAEDGSIAEVSPSDTGESCTVTAGEPGMTTVTVSVTDEKGRPVQSINPRTVRINCVSHITDITISEADINVSKGESHEMKIDITPSNATDSVTWSTSDESVAVVDENGVVTGTGGGEAVITVTTPNGLSDSRRVYVYEKAKDLAIVPEELTMHEGDFDVIWATAENARANGEVTWTVDDPSKAAFYARNEETGEMEIVDTVTTKLSADGTGSSEAYALIAGIAQGTVTVTAATEGEDGNLIEKTCTVTVGSSERYVQITLNGASISGEMLELDLAGHLVQLGAESSEDGDSYTWTTVDDTADPVLTVDQSGRVILRRKGTAAVKVTSNITEETDVCLIKVIANAEGVRLSVSELELEAGMNTTITASLVPEGSDGNVIWSSSDEKVATVSADGKVTAVGPGEAVITAVPDIEGTESATCKVTVTAVDPVVRLDNSTKIMLEKGKKVQINATVTPSTAQGEITWESSDNTIASVTQDGVITGLKEGECDITARFSQQGSHNATCHVTVYTADNAGDDAVPSDGNGDKTTPEQDNGAGGDPNQMGADGTAAGRGASAAAIEKAITSMETDDDLPGSVFEKLAFRSQKQAKSSINLKWNNVVNAGSYVIYGNKCGKGNKPVKLAVVSDNKLTVKSINEQKLKNGTYYKFILVALDKDNNVISTSKVIHVATKGGKVGNHKKVTVKKSVIKKAKKLKAGKSLKLKAKAVPQSKKRKVKKHVAVRYESTNTNIVTVSKKGVVKAKAKGTCHVYAYAQDGVFKEIMITVK